MTEEKKQLMLKRMTGETDLDVLSTYLTLAAGVVVAKAYPYGTGTEEVPAAYETVQVEIAAYMLNKRGAEGQLQHTENGIQRQYENADVPASMLKPVTPHVGVIK